MMKREFINPRTGRRMLVDYGPPITREAARRTQLELDRALGDPAEADRLIEPLLVRELSDDQVRELCPEFADTVPGEC